VTALKDHVDASLVRTLADALAASDPSFPRDEFVAAACAGLESLELKARIRHIADVLQTVLPTEVPPVVAAIDGTLATGALDGWSAWPLAEVAGRLGPRDPVAVLPLLARLTPVMSCEFALRPCLAAHPELTFEHLERWVDDVDEHVRRLVSEGTRPRLPWGERLRTLQADPSPAIRLLDRLRDDPAEYVRRSVANHLGDIAKDHPDLALATAQRWTDEGGDHVHEVVRHGLRTLVKAGDPTALALLGYDADAAVVLRGFTVEPARIPIGGTVQVCVDLAADGSEPIPVVVEYVVTFLGPRGPRKPKAFRLAERVLAPGEEVRLQRRHRFDHASIRTLHPGTQPVTVQVNGRALGTRDVHLTP
jgi:3-methyladenine DNA glycosylase AlkC